MLEAPSIPFSEGSKTAMHSCLHAMMLALQVQADNGESSHRSRKREMHGLDKAKERRQQAAKSAVNRFAVLKHKRSGKKTLRQPKAPSSKGGGSKYSKGRKRR